MLEDFRTVLLLVGECLGGRYVLRPCIERELPRGFLVYLFFDETGTIYPDANVDKVPNEYLIIKLLIITNSIYLKSQVFHTLFLVSSVQHCVWSVILDLSLHKNVTENFA